MLKAFQHPSILSSIAYQAKPLPYLQAHHTKYVYHPNINTVKGALSKPEACVALEEMDVRLTGSICLAAMESVIHSGLRTGVGFLQTPMQGSI